MKYSKSILLVGLAALCGVASVLAQAPGKKQKAPPLPGAGTGGTTPHATISTVVGPNRASGSMITITYGRPFLKHPRTGEVRQVWGGLVKWDKADRLGADEATLFINQHDIVAGGTTIPKGAYTLYIVPSEAGTSKLAFSKNIGKWGVPVDETSDVARVELKKDVLNEVVEQLTISVENATQPPSLDGMLKIKWEKTQFSLPFTVKK
jgi:hypothetical protein